MVETIAVPVAHVGFEGTLVPMDDANRRLLERVGPRGWVNPQSRGVYDLVVVGGGTAGLVSAIGAARLGARVAMIERGLLGGDCLTTGCVPSKALLRSARAVGELRCAGGVGVRVGGVEADFASIVRRMRERRAEISAHDSIARVREAGVDLFFGHGRFTDDRAIEVDGQTLTFNRAVIATGSRPTKPSLRGLDQVSYLTSETVFSLTELPRRLLVIGAGPIGCELAQAFARFESTVTVFEVAARVLPAFDADAGSIVHRRLAADGVTFHLGVKLTEVTQEGPSLVVRYEHPTGSNQVTADQLLIADGRTPNVDGLGLDVAEVAVSEHGIVVDDRLRTSNRRIYAAGDVCSRFKFTHAADALARVAVQNALFLGRRRASSLVIPRCVYTDPEVADVGTYENDARHEGRHIETITIPLSDVDRAIIDDEADGFVRLHHDRGRLLGATIVAPHAGDLIAEPTFALTHRHALADLARTIHPYPTQSESLRLAADAHRRSQLTPRVRAWLERYFRWTR